MPSTPRLAAAALTATALAAAGLLAASGPAQSVVSMKTAYGTATKTSDGDTVYVDLPGDGKGTMKIRNAGIQALETSHPDPAECHANAARSRMRQLVDGKRVRLQAHDTRATSEGRPVRFIDVPTKYGYVDTQLVLLNEGHVMWFPGFAGETSRTVSYHLAMEQAVARKKNLWQDNYCGNGPSQGAKLKMWINYDASGDDATNLNGEYVRVKNVGTTAADLSHWHVRDASHRAPLFFPSGTVLAPGQLVTVHTGSGQNTTTDFYQGQTATQWPNIVSVHDEGDGAYLFDPQGDIRSHITYPCVTHCQDARIGRLAISVQYDAPGTDAENVNGEFLDLHSVGTTKRVDVSHTVLTQGGRVWELPEGSYLDPGEHLRVYSGHGSAGRLSHYWGSDEPLLGNGGGSTLLRTTEGKRLACTAWGTARC